MADIGNQLEGVGDGLDRFLGALDDASYKLGSNAALQATQARAAKKMQDQDIRFKKRLDKIETDHAKQIKTMQPVYKKLWTGIKDEVKQRSLLSKGMKDMTKSMTDFAKKAIGGMGKGIMAMGKAGVLGGMVAAVKLISDGLLRGDAAMAKLSDRTKMTRKELSGVREAAKGAQNSMSQFGVTMEQTLATSGNLVEAFGSAKYVTDQLVESATRLELAYGLSASESANLVEGLTRANQEARTFIDAVGSKAVSAGVSASLVMRDLASRTQQIAMHGERGNEAMIQMAVTAAKAGTSMKAFDGAASAFGDMDTIASNMGDLGARFGEDFTKGWGNAEEQFFAFFEGGEAQAKQDEKRLKSMAAQFDISKEHGLVDARGRKVEAGWQKKMAEAAGIELEALLRMIDARDKENAEIEYQMSLGADEFKKWQADQKVRNAAAAAAEKHENKIMRDRNSMIKQVTNLWTGLYSTLSGQLNEIFGVDSDTGLSGKIARIGESLKIALNLDSFADDVKGGTWAEAIGTRVKAVMKKALSTVFPDFAKELEGAGGGIDGFIAVVKAKLATAIKSGIADAFGTDADTVDLGSLAKTAAGAAAAMGAVGGIVKVMGALKGTFLNPMWVQMKGMGGLRGGPSGAPAGPAGPKPRGAAGTAYDTSRARGTGRIDAASSALKQAGQGNIVKGTAKVAGQQALTSSKNAAKLAGLATKSVGKGLLKKIPFLGAAAGIYFAYDRIANGGDWLGGMLELGSGLASIIPGLGTAVSAGIDTASMARDVSRMHTEQPTAVEQAVEASALGRIGGGLSIVGEAGGEVVASRSALRSGVGIGGRAASALAGIGVPGYRTGYASMDISGIHGRQGLQGALGSQAGKGAIASGFQKEQARQQAAMMEYWRNHYEDKMDDMVDEKVKKDKQGPPWVATMFLKYNKEIGEQLKKTGPTVSAALMTGMTKWAKGGSISDAINVGAKAGILAGINDPESKLNTYLKKTGEWQSTLTAGLTAFASGGNVGRSMVRAGSHALAGMIGGGSASKTAAEYMGMGNASGFRDEATKQGKGRMSGMFAAKGKYVNSPTLMMVGEGGASEVVIPTERIRKGLPINAGVAAELGSIGVPGFVNGGRFGSGNMAGGGGIGIRNTGALPSAPMATPSLGIGKSAVRSRSSGYGAGVSGRFDDMGGFGGMAKAGGAGALMSFGNIFAQTGDWKQAATGGVGAGIGVGAGLGLTALGIPPPLSGMIGNMVGGLATKGLNSVFNITGGYGKGRRKTLKKLESHIKTGGRFDYGAPSGLNKAMTQAVGGYEKTPTEANFQKLSEKLGTSKLVSSMGVPAPALIALGMGQMRGEAATKMFSAINTSLYGKGGGDKYRNALAVSAVPALAAGGIVNRPTTALIGERGPEAVIPLGNSEMMQELKKQNKLMAEMIKTQKETAQTTIRMDGRIVAETVGQNMYDIGTGM